MKKKKNKQTKKTKPAYSSVSACGDQHDGFPWPLERQDEVLQLLLATEASAKLSAWGEFWRVPKSKAQSKSVFLGFKSALKSKICPNSIVSGIPDRNASFHFFEAFWERSVEVLGSFLIRVNTKNKNMISCQHLAKTKKTMTTTATWLPHVFSH